MSDYLVRDVLQSPAVGVLVNLEAEGFSIVAVEGDRLVLSREAA